VRATRPAAGPPHAFFKFRAHPFDVLPPRFIFLDGDGPADPLVARERRYVFPGSQRLRVEGKRISEIGWKVMHDTSGDSNACHEVISSTNRHHLKRESDSVSRHSSSDAHFKVNDGSLLARVAARSA
jgi:hypothetical protein